MIRINLLGVPKPKKGKRAAAATAAIPGEGPNPVVVLAVATVLALAGVGGWYWWLDREAAQIAADLQKANVENQRLAGVKARFEEQQKQADMYKRRIDVITQLRDNQKGPIDLLTMIGNTVNSTEAVWLNSMLETGNKIEIEGMALSNTAVANLITNLQKGGYFKTVEIKETVQDEKVKEMQAFVFTLTCERADAPPPAAPAGGAAATPGKS
jgi:type IV pilus assembly protein PilN